MKLINSLLLRALRKPSSIQGFTEDDWDLLVRQGRASGLLGRLGARIQAAGLTTDVPAPAWRHMSAMLTIAERQKQAVLWEVKQLSVALATLGAPIVLLKGAAYAAADLPPAAGRTFSDIDVLVPKRFLGDVEKHLMLSGWTSSHLDPYDQRYYRQWMHELPPLAHLQRGTGLDVHHNVLPETARTKVRPDLILADARPLAGYDNIFVPCPEDQVIHSATHLYHEGEWGHGLRDLSDLDCLMRSYGQNEDFLTRLTKRAQALNLVVPLVYAMHNTRSVFGTPLSDAFLSQTIHLASWPKHALMNPLLMGALGAAHSSLASTATPIAAAFMYVRSHWLRMPLHLLIPHFWHKALKKAQQDGTSSRDEAGPRLPGGG